MHSPFWAFCNYSWSWRSGVARRQVLGCFFVVARVNSIAVKHRSCLFWGWGVGLVGERGTACIDCMYLKFRNAYAHVSLIRNAHYRCQGVIGLVFHWDCILGSRGFQMQARVGVAIVGCGSGIITMSSFAKHMARVVTRVAEYAFVVCVCSCSSRLFPRCEMFLACTLPFILQWIFMFFGCKFTWMLRFLLVVWASQRCHLLLSIQLSLPHVQRNMHILVVVVLAYRVCFQNMKCVPSAPFH